MLEDIFVKTKKLDQLL